MKSKNYTQITFTFNQKIMKKKNIIFVGIILIISIFFIYKIIEYYNWKNDPFRPLTKEERNEIENKSDKDESNISKEIDTKNNEIGCSGFGDESCIDEVRENFTNTGKQILGEEYLDNGQFGISFLDATRGQAYNSKVSTDCNCKVINVDISIMR